MDDNKGLGRVPEAAHAALSPGEIMQRKEEASRQRELLGGVPAKGFAYQSWHHIDRFSADTHITQMVNAKGSVACEVK